MKTMEERIEQAITEQDIRNIENGIAITDIDLRVLELEVKGSE